MLLTIVRSMTIELGNDSVDLGIVVSDSDSARGFYRDLLGMVHEGDMPMPVGGGGTMHRLRCGRSLIKVIKFDDNPRSAAGGPIQDALGFRYLTIHCTNIAEVLTDAEAAGVEIVLKRTELRPGVTVAMMYDPDGNIVELVNYA